MSDSPVTSAPLRSTAVKRSRESAKSIMIVDDSAPFRERLGRAFRERGFEVRTAGNYEEAIQQMGHHEPPHFCVVDLRMPGPSGLTLVRDLKQLYPNMQVLVLSGFGSISTAVDALHLGAVNFLPKPADADDILAAFERGERALQPADTQPETPSLARAEWEHIHRVLADCGGNVSEAARRLGIHRRSLQRKLRKRAPEQSLECDDKSSHSKDRLLLRGDF